MNLAGGAKQKKRDKSKGRGVPEKGDLKNISTIKIIIFKSFANSTNSNFLIPISLQPNIDLELWNFKLKLPLDQIR